LSLMNAQPSLIKSAMKKYGHNLVILNAKIDSLDKMGGNFEKRSNNLIDLHRNYKLESTKIHDLVEKFEHQESLRSIDLKFKLSMLYLGIYFLAVGMLIWLGQEGRDKKLQYRLNIDKPTYSHYCQSCGKDFSPFIKYGTEKNETKNYHFCISCFKDGEFTEPELKLGEQLLRLQNELRSINASKKEINKITEKIKLLDRWKQNRYSSVWLIRSRPYGN